MEIYNTFFISKKKPKKLLDIILEMNLTGRSFLNSKNVEYFLVRNLTFCSNIIKQKIQHK